MQPIPRNISAGDQAKIDLFKEGIKSHLMEHFSKNPQDALKVAAMGPKAFVDGFMNSLNPNDVPIIVHDRNVKNDVSKFIKHPKANQLFPDLIDIKDLNNLVVEIAAHAHAKDRHEQNLLHVAINRRDLSLAKLAIFFKPSLVLETAKQGATPLHFAAAEGFAEVIDFLMKPDSISTREESFNDEVDIDVQDDDKSSPLHVAVMSGHLDTVKKLLSYKPNKAVEDSHGLTPADWANFRLHSVDMKSGRHLKDNPLEAQKFTQLMALTESKQGVLPIGELAKRLGMKEVK